MSKDFTKTLIQAGVDELRFFILTKKSGLYFDNTESWQECYISEHRYRISDDYKITLVPIDQRYCGRDYYISDFESLLEEGFIIKKTHISDHVKNIQWIEFMGNVPIVHTANILVHI